MRRKYAVVAVVSVLVVLFGSFQNCQRSKLTVFQSYSDFETDEPETSAAQAVSFRATPKLPDECRFVVQLDREVAAKISDIQVPGGVAVKKRRKVSRKYIQDQTAALLGTSLETEPVFNAIHQVENPGKKKRSRKKVPVNSQGMDSLIERLSNTFVIRAQGHKKCAAAYHQLKKDKRVLSIAPDHEQVTTLVPNDPFYSSSGTWQQEYRDLWGLDSIHAEKAWDIAQGENTVVAVVDSGVDMQHPDIAENIWKNPGETGVVNGVDLATNGIDDDQNGFIDDVNGWNFVSNTNDPTDDNGHGTHVSGTIAAVGNNSIGIIGVAPKAKIMPVKVLNDKGGGESSAVSQGIKYAVDMGADVINLSLGPGGRCLVDPVKEDALRYAAKNGVIVVIAAGNSSDDVAMSCPLGMMVEDRPIVVSAHTPTSQLASFSNYGDFIDVSAPGGGDVDPNILPSTYTTNLSSNILSLLAQKHESNIDYLNKDSFKKPFIFGDQDRYSRLAGTSMATPHVAGVAAVLISRFPSLSILQLKRLMFSYAQDFGLPDTDRFFGFGGVDLDRSIRDEQPKPVGRLYMPIRADRSQLVQIYGIATAKAFSNYEIFYAKTRDATEWSRTGVRLVSDGKVEKEGLLATWNAGVTRASRKWCLKLVVRDQSGAESVAYYDYLLPASEKPGWPVALYEDDVPILASRLYGVDFNLDGKKEIFLRSFKGGGWEGDGLFILDSLGKFLPHFSPEESSHWTRVESGILDQSDAGAGQIDDKVFLNVNGDSRLEILTQRRKTFRHDDRSVEFKYYVAAHDLDGNIQPFSDQVDFSFSSMIPSIEPGQRDPNLVFANSERFLLSDLRGQVLEQSTYSERADCGLRVDATPGNTIRNSYGLYAKNSQYFLRINQANGTLIREFPVGIASCLSELFMVRDLNGDRDPEIILIDFQSRLDGALPGVFVYNSQGQLLPGWPYRLPVIKFKVDDRGHEFESQTTGSGRIEVADLNNDGRPEILFGTKVWAPILGPKFVYPSRQLMVLNLSGKEAFKKPIRFERQKFVDFVVEDLNHDGRKEIITSSNSLDEMHAQLDVFSPTGGLIKWWTQMIPFVSMVGPPLVTDLENDGRMEIGVHAGDQIHLWTY